MHHEFYDFNLSAVEAYDPDIGILAPMKRVMFC